MCLVSLPPMILHAVAKTEMLTRGSNFCIITTPLLPTDIRLLALGVQGSVRVWLCGCDADEVIRHSLAWGHAGRIAARAHDLAPNRLHSSSARVSKTSTVLYIVPAALQSLVCSALRTRLFCLWVKPLRNRNTHRGPSRRRGSEHAPGPLGRGMRCPVQMTCREPLAGSGWQTSLPRGSESREAQWQPVLGFAHQMVCEGRNRASRALGSPTTDLSVNSNN